MADLNRTSVASDHPVSLFNPSSVIIPGKRAKDGIYFNTEILSALRQPYALTGANAQISASMGISSFPRDGDDPDNLLHAADLAMYQAKAQGKDNVQ